ncbi:MAG: hypothetical protein ACK5MB_13215, partial [Phycisphaerales bacterium]
MKMIMAPTAATVAEGRTAAPAPPQMSSAGQQNTFAGPQKSSGGQQKTFAGQQNAPGGQQNTFAGQQKSSGSQQNSSAGQQKSSAGLQFVPYAPPENANVPRTRREVASNCGERAAKRRESSNFKRGKVQSGG